MEEIKVGEYVRDRGELLKIEDIINIDEDSVYIKFKEYAGGNTFYKSEIEKWKKSKNIIDLIEVGDYVNGKEICLKDEKENAVVWGFQLRDEQRIFYLYEQDIKSIVTREMMKSVEYRVY